MFWKRPTTTPGRPSGNRPEDTSPPTGSLAEAIPSLPSVSPPSRRFTDGASGCATRLGRLQIRGTLTSRESVELGGTFDGPIEVEGLLEVFEGGRVTGRIRAQDAVIAGEVHGQLTARGRLEMGASARVLADVEAKTIAIAEGAFIAGRVTMPGGNGAAPQAPQATSFNEKRRNRRKARPAAAPGAHESPAGPKAGGDPADS